MKDVVTEIEAHPAADIFPMMDEHRLSELAQDIRDNGQREPIKLLGGKILDGRNRYAACQMVQVTPIFTEISSDENPWRLVWSLNGARRDITTDQRFIAWQKCEEAAAEYEKQAEKRRKAANEARAKAAEDGRVGRAAAAKKSEKADRSPRNDDPDLGDEFSAPTKGGETKPQTAKTKNPGADTKAASAGVGRKTVEDCEWLQKHRPDLYERVASGEFSSSKARNIAKKEARAADIAAQKAAIEAGEASLPDGVFEVVTMDPPWKYGREYDPESSRVANPYPEMTQAELMAMDAPFADDCVLFLWTTHQFIWDAKALLDHWGFNYKATLVWDKERIGMGATVRMQCEFCLLAFRGKPTWSNTTWRDIMREPRREHSRKPEVFYQMVEDCTVGRRLEMFSREQRPGWGVFGNDTAKF